MLIGRTRPLLLRSPPPKSFFFTLLFTSTAQADMVRRKHSMGLRGWDLGRSLADPFTLAAPAAPASTDFTINKPGTKVTLVVDGSTVQVNKEVLSYHSNYFNTLFGSPNFVESSSDRIEIKHDYEQLRKCMEIAHGAAPVPTGKMPLSDLHSLILSGNRFDLSVVRTYCESELMARREGDLVRAYLIASHFEMNDAKKVLMGQVTVAAVQEWINTKGITRTVKYDGPPELTISSEALRSLIDKR